MFINARHLLGAISPPEYARENKDDDGATAGARERKHNAHVPAQRRDVECNTSNERTEKCADLNTNNTALLSLDAYATRKLASSQSGRNAVARVLRLTRPLTRASEKPPSALRHSLPFPLVPSNSHTHKRSPF